MRSASATSRCCSTGNRISLCTPSTKTGVFASGRRPAARPERYGGGFDGGGCDLECDVRRGDLCGDVRVSACDGDGNGAEGVMLSAVSADSDMSKMSIALE